MPNDEHLLQRLMQVDELVHTLDAAADSPTRAVAKELFQLLLEMHRVGLSRLLQIVSQNGDAHQAILEGCRQDELLAQLLILHGLHPADLESRVRQALENVRPRLRAHGAEVELIAMSERGVRLRLSGVSQCSSTVEACKRAVEDAVCETASDVAVIEFMDGEMRIIDSPSGFMALPVLNNLG